MSTQLSGDSPQLKIANELRRGYEEKDLSVLVKHLHKDFRRFTYPKSIGQPERNKEEWLKHVAGVMDFATALEVGYTSYLLLSLLAKYVSRRRPLIPS